MTTEDIFAQAEQELARILWRLLGTGARARVFKSELVEWWQLSDDYRLQQSAKTVSETVSRICKWSGGTLSFDKDGERVSYVRKRWGRQTIFVPGDSDGLR